MKFHSTSDFRKNDFDTFVGRANIVLNCVKVNGTKQLITGMALLLDLEVEILVSSYHRRKN